MAIPRLVVHGDTSSLSPNSVQGRTERLSVKEIHGVGMRWLALTPDPSPVRGRGETRATRRGVLMRQKLRELIYSVRP